MQPALSRAILALLTLALLGSPCADAGMGFGNPKLAPGADEAGVALLVQALLTGGLLPG